MKGYLVPTRSEHPPEGGNLPRWQKRVADAMGTAIEFWGFKSNHGRVWALLYLEARPLSAAEIQKQLGMSKGAVSMITRELEQWRVVHRVELEGSSSWHFEAETDLFEMIRHVIEERESQLISRIERDLGEAELEARAAGVDPEVIERIHRLRTLARRMSQAVEAFLKTARFDVAGVTGLLLDTGRKALRRRRD
jgi:DNA-binding transcriptional regulator GbsR (MarR family)